MLQRFSGPSHYKYVLLLLLLYSETIKGLFVRIELQNLQSFDKLINECLVCAIHSHSFIDIAFIVSVDLRTHRFISTNLCKWRRLE